MMVKTMRIVGKSINGLIILKKQREEYGRVKNQEIANGKWRERELEHKRKENMEKREGRADKQKSWPKARRGKRMLRDVGED